MAKKTVQTSIWVQMYAGNWREWSMAGLYPSKLICQQLYKKVGTGLMTNNTMPQRLIKARGAATKQYFSHFIFCSWLFLLEKNLPFITRILESFLRCHWQGYNVRLTDKKVLCHIYDLLFFYKIKQLNEHPSRVAISYFFCQGLWNSTKSSEYSHMRGLNESVQIKTLICKP